MLLRELFPLKPLEYKDDGDHKWSEYFGVELELEGVVGPPAIPYWSQHIDESLRNGIEYVLTRPLGGTKLERALTVYYSNGTKTNSTERSSTHIHVNMTTASVDELRTMIVLMYTLEGPLYSVVGESRKWAGYSMSLSEMEPSRMTRIMQDNDRDNLIASINTGRNADKYYGLNVASVRKHGTAEFRYFPGDPTQKELESWLDLVAAIKSASKKYVVSQIIERVDNEMDLLALMQEILPNYWYEKLAHARPVEEVLLAFNTIAAMSTINTEEDLRRDPLVFFNAPLLAYTLKREPSEEGRDYIKNIAAKLNVVTGSEWHYHLQKAQQLSAKKNGDIDDAPVAYDNWDIDLQSRLRASLNREQARINRDIEVRVDAFDDDDQ